MPGRSIFTDTMREIDQAEAYARPPGPPDHILTRIMSWLQTANITVSPPAHIRPIIWSQPVDLSARVSVPAAVGNYVTAISFTAPPGRSVRISGYGVEVQDAAYTYDGSILWRLRKNGHPLDDGLSDWGEQRGSLQIPRKTFIILNEDDTVEFQVRRAVVAGAPQNVDMALVGWTWLLRNNYEGTASSVTAF